jgi:hypothetical protein
VQQKYWNLVVLQQERGEKKDQGAREGVRDQREHFQQKQLLEQRSYPFPGWKKTLGMPGYWICIILVKSSSQKSCKKSTTLRIQLLHELLLQNTIIKINSFIKYSVVAP